MAGWKKIIDFKDLGPDTGLYNNRHSRLDFYQEIRGPNVVFVTEQDAHVVITRDGSTGTVFGYVNGNQEISFTDTNGLAIFNATDNIVRFFQDDNTTSHAEASSGRVDCIKIWDGPLATTEVSQLLSNPCKLHKPLLVELANFTTTPFQNDIRVHWKTTSEVDNAGFYLWRATGEGWKEGNYFQVIRITNPLIPSKGTKVGGYSYSYVDSNVESGITYYYGLEDIGFNGQSTVHWDFIDEATAK